MYFEYLSKLLKEPLLYWALRIIRIGKICLKEIFYDKQQVSIVIKRKDSYC